MDPRGPPWTPRVHERKRAFLRIALGNDESAQPRKRSIGPFSSRERAGAGHETSVRPPHPCDSHLTVERQGRMSDWVQRSLRALVCDNDGMDICDIPSQIVDSFSWRIQSMYRELLATEACGDLNTANGREILRYVEEV